MSNRVARAPEHARNRKEGRGGWLHFSPSLKKFASNFKLKCYTKIFYMYNVQCAVQYNVGETAKTSGGRNIEMKENKSSVESMLRRGRERKETEEERKENLKGEEREKRIQRGKGERRGTEGLISPLEKEASCYL